MGKLLQIGDARLFGNTFTVGDVDVQYELPLQGTVEQSDGAIFFFEKFLLSTNGVDANTCRMGWRNGARGGRGRVGRTSPLENRSVIVANSHSVSIGNERDYNAGVARSFFCPDLNSAHGILKRVFASRGSGGFMIHGVKTSQN